jgi:hypothetical protein
VRDNAGMLGTLRRLGPLGLSLAGSVLLVAAEFFRLYEVKVITVTVASQTVGAHHRYALLVIGVAALALAVLATRYWPPSIALVLLGAAALVVVLAFDLPIVDDTGLYGKNYEQAAAQAGPGFYLETLGAVLLLLGAVAMAVFGPARAARPAATREPVAPAAS